MKRAIDCLIEHYPAILLFFGVASFILVSLINNDSA